MATNKMELLRGIIIVTHDNKLMVKTAGAIYNLPPMYEPFNFNINDKVFGLVIDNLFNVIFSLKLDNKEVVNGYFKDKGITNKITFVQIENFNEIHNNIYDSEAKLSQPFIIQENEIKQLKISA